MDEEESMFYMSDLESEYKLDILQEWQTSKGKEGIFQHWRVMKYAMVKREYRNYAMNLPLNEKNIDKLQEICIENYLKLKINTVLCQHTPIDPYDYMEGYIDDKMTKEEFEKLFEDFEWFACDEFGNWRISDYGLEKIGSNCYALLETDDYNQKLYHIDCILSVVHQRSNLSSWFIEGGANTLDEIFTQNPVMQTA